MAEQTIKPVLPVTRPQDVLKKKKGDGKKNPTKTRDAEHNKKNKKGIIDTYA